MSDWDALCDAANAAEEYSLYALADFLEEQGDNRGRYLRHLANAALIPLQADGLYGWTHCTANAYQDASHWEASLPSHVFSALRENVLPGSAGHYRWYPSRLAAYLAAAEALLLACTEEGWINAGGNQGVEATPAQ